MSAGPMRGLFVTGTDTGVGKTRLASAIAAALVSDGLRVGVVKPVATGAEAGADGQLRWPDAEALAAAVGGEVPRERVAPLVFEAALAPPVAARNAGGFLTAEAVLEATAEALRWWRSERGAEVVVVEGIGGFLCPLAEGMVVADLAVDLDFPLLIVARRGLGTLNHTLLTVEAALGRGLRVAGVVLNGAEPTRDFEAEAEKTNPAELCRRLPAGIPLLADLPYQADAALSPPAIDVDWRGRCAASRRAGGSAR